MSLSRSLATFFICIAAGLVGACATTSGSSRPNEEASSSAAGSEPQNAGVALFNGRDLSGWEGDVQHWSVQDGAITGETTPSTTGKAGTYLVWRGGTVGDFKLRVVYRFVGPGNSGVQYRSREQADYVVHGYQADFETSHGQKWTGALVDMGGRLHLGLRGQRTVVAPNGKVQVVGSLGDPEQLKSHLRPDGWNEYIVVAKGNRLIHTVNGQTMVDVTDNQEDRRTLSGILALQLSRSAPMKVQFKAIELQPVD